MACSLLHIFGNCPDMENQRRLSPSIVYIEYAIKQVSCGQKHIAILGYDGRVMTCGSNEYSQLGYQMNYNKMFKDVRINNISHLSCGFYHNVAITHNNQVFVWGDNKSGQCGVTVDTNVSAPKMLNIKAKESSCGARHTLLLTKQGEVYGMGSNESGQLGLKELKTFKPLRIQFLESITQIAAGYEYSLFLTELGHVYAVGDNTNGQLGTGSGDNERECKKVKGLFGQFVTKISAGNASLALTHSNSLYIWGYGEFNIPFKVFHIKTTLEEVGMYGEIGLCKDIENQHYIWSTNNLSTIFSDKQYYKNGPTLIKQLNSINIESACGNKEYLIVHEGLKDRLTIESKIEVQPMPLSKQSSLKQIDYRAKIEQYQERLLNQQILNRNLAAKLQKLETEQFIKQDQKEQSKKELIQAKELVVFQDKIIEQKNNNLAEYQIKLSSQAEEIKQKTKVISKMREELMECHDKIIALEIENSKLKIHQRPAAQF